MERVHEKRLCSMVQSRPCLQVSFLAGESPCQSYNSGGHFEHFINDKNVKAIIVSKMTSHCAGTVQMREQRRVQKRDKKVRKEM